MKSLMILTSLLSLLTLVVECYSISEGENLIPDERLHPQIGPSQVGIPSSTDHLNLEKEHEIKPLADDIAIQPKDRNLDRLATNKEDNHVVDPNHEDIQTINENLKQQMEHTKPINGVLEPKGMYGIKYLVRMLFILLYVLV